MTADASIAAVEAVPVRIEGRRHFRISEGAAKVHTSIVLRLRTDRDDLEGHAEIVSAPPGKPEEFVEEILGAVQRYVTPALVGVAVGERTVAMQRVEQVLKGRSWTKAAVNVALYDLHAKSLGVPVADLLGGRLTTRVPVIGPVIGIMDAEAMAAEAAVQSEAGFRTVKIKVGENVNTDVGRVAAVREALGANVALRVDANDHYQPVDAVRLARAIQRYDIEHLEQPVSRRDLLGMAEVRRGCGIPVMTDDAVATPEEAMQAIRLGACDRMKVKVSKHGLDGARIIVDMLEAAGLSAVLGHVFEMGLAAAAEAQFASCTSGLAEPHEMGSMRPMGVATDIIAEDFAPKAGWLDVPDGPGLGVTLSLPSQSRRDEAPG
jgi:L-alanine-DL-glutamate epimerase-like enolase superfamily enzyme